MADKIVCGCKSSWDFQDTAVVFIGNILVPPHSIYGFRYNIWLIRLGKVSSSQKTRGFHGAWFPFPLHYLVPNLFSYLWEEGLTCLSSWCRKGWGGVSPWFSLCSSLNCFLNGNSSVTLAFIQDNSEQRSKTTRCMKTAQLNCIAETSQMFTEGYAPSSY